MHKLSERGVVHLLVPIILLLGLIAGVYLITSGNPLKLFSKAASNPIIFVLPDGSKCNPATTSCKIATSSATVRVELTSTLGSPVSSPTTSASNVLGESEQISLDGFRKTVGSKKGDARYNPLYDANNDGRINITDFSKLIPILRRIRTITPPSPSQPPASTQVINLSAGWDSFGLTVLKINYKAEDLLKEFNSQLIPAGSQASQIIRWNNGNQEVHNLGQPANNFDIKIGEGYLIRTTKGGKVSLAGDKTGVSTVNISQGYSAFSLTEVPSRMKTAEDLLQEMKKQGIGVSQISTWVNGAWSSHILGFPANNYQIESGKGYLVRNSGAAKYFDITLPSSPAPTPTPEAVSPPPVSSPKESKTKYYKIAENPTDLSSATWQIYDREPKIVDYTFREATPGAKFIWVEFKDSTGRTDRKSAQIELVAPTSTPTSSPIPSLTPAPTSTSAPTPSPSNSYRLVFATSTKYNGNLGGLSGADTKCQERATAVGLSGAWKAWISDNSGGFSTDASHRLNHSQVPYKLVNGTKVANNWADLVDQSLLSPINVTERGESTSAVENRWDVWTNTSEGGHVWEAQARLACNNWTSDSSSHVGSGGSTAEASYRWSATEYAGHGCNTVARLYCFEQIDRNSPPPSAFGLTVSPETISAKVALGKSVKVFDVTADEYDINYEIYGWTERRLAQNILNSVIMSPAGGFLGKELTTPITLFLGNNEKLDTYDVTVRIKNTANNIQRLIPVKLTVNPDINYNQPRIDTISVERIDPYDYDSQQRHIKISGSGFNYNPGTFGTETIYRSLKFRDARGVVRSQITLPSNSSLIHDNWSDTYIEKKFVNRVTFLEAFIEVYIYSSSGKTVLATSNVKRVF